MGNKKIAMEIIRVVGRFNIAEGSDGKFYICDFNGKIVGGPFNTLEAALNAAEDNIKKSTPKQKPIKGPSF